MSTRSLNNRAAKRAGSFFAALALIACALHAPAARAAGAQPAADDLAPCGLQAGTLTTVLTPDENSDFVVFGLYDDKGEEIARQFIPIYNPNASAELMVTPIGFGGAVASVKCLADPGVKRCNDPNWVTDEGLIVALSGMVIGPDFAIASIGGRYHRPATTAQLAIDGGMAGFQIDKGPIVWAVFFNSEQQVTQAFFDLKAGVHSLTIGARDPETSKFVPQERFCFQT